MKPKQVYTSNDLECFARRGFPNEFEAFRNLYTCKFEDKPFLDKNSAAHKVTVISVGHYHVRQRGPSVWAKATKTGIRYFYGKPSESVITPVLQGNVTRIYYAAPYSSVIESQGGGARTASWKAGHLLVETIINVLFLVSNPGKTDMLSNFKYVCTSALRPRVQDIARAATLHRTELSPALDGPKNKKRKRSSSVHGQHTKQEEIDEDDIDFIGSVSQRQDQPEHRLSPMPYRLASGTPQTPPFDRARNDRVQGSTELEQRQRSRRQEVHDLQAKLLGQELKIQAAEESTMKEEKKRKRAEEQVENLMKQLATFKESKVDGEVQVMATSVVGAADRQSKEIAKLRLQNDRQQVELAKLRTQNDKQRIELDEARSHTRKLQNALEKKRAVAERRNTTFQRLKDQLTESAQSYSHFQRCGFGDTGCMSFPMVGCVTRSDAHEAIAEFGICLS